MAFSYRPLWVMLASRDMKKKDLIRIAELSPCTMTSLKNGENLNTSSLNRICNALGCRIEDIMEHIPDEKTDEEIKET